MLLRYSSKKQVFFTLSCAFFLFNYQNPSKECEPYRTNEDKPIAPCGAIANSMFNGMVTLLSYHLGFFVI